MWTKICGVTNVEDAKAVVAAGGTAIGLNFYSRSPRSVDLSTAVEICRALSGQIQFVGVFVNESIAAIKQTADACLLDSIQLHGEESPGFLADLQAACPSCCVIRAWRSHSENWDELAAYLTECRRLNVLPSSLLLDAHVAGTFGGSGKTLAWQDVAENYRYEEWPRLILAGGLHAENVAAAVNTADPWGVDTASGVEARPGVKDHQQVSAFIRAANFQP